MFLSVVVLVNLDTATMVVRHPEMAFETPVVAGKPATPTPEGIYVLEKAYSATLDMPILIFRKDENIIYAIHSNLPSRQRNLQSLTITDNRLSGGCIGIEQKQFDKLWQSKKTMVLQVYGGFNEH